jgi:hypothetical protein
LERGIKARGASVAVLGRIRRSEHTDPALVPPAEARRERHGVDVAMLLTGVGDTFEVSVATETVIVRASFSAGGSAAILVKEALKALDDGLAGRGSPATRTATTPPAAALLALESPAAPAPSPESAPVPAPTQEADGTEEADGTAKPEPEPVSPISEPPPPIEPVADPPPPLTPIAEPAQPIVLAPEQPTPPVVRAAQSPASPPAAPDADGDLFSRRESQGFGLTAAGVGTLRGRTRGLFGVVGAQKTFGWASTRTEVQWTLDAALSAEIGPGSVEAALEIPLPSVSPQVAAALALRSAWLARATVRATAGVAWLDAEREGPAVRLGAFGGADTVFGSRVDLEVGPAAGPLAVLDLWWSGGAVAGAASRVSLEVLVGIVSSYSISLGISYAP